MEKLHRINFTSHVIFVLISIFIFSSCSSQKNIKIFIEKGSTDKEYIVSEKDIIFQYFFNDTVKVFTDKKVIFLENIITNNRLQVAEKYCTIKVEEIPKSGLVYIEISGKKFRLKLKNEYTFYYLNYLDKKLTAVCTNIERKFY